MNFRNCEFFNSTKGFGFIEQGGGQPDVFVHISAVERAGIQTLVEGQKLTFDVVMDSRKGKSGEPRTFRLPDAGVERFWPLTTDVLASAIEASRRRSGLPGLFSCLAKEATMKSMPETGLFKPKPSTLGGQGRRHDEGGARDHPQRGCGGDAKTERLKAARMANPPAQPAAATAKKGRQTLIRSSGRRWVSCRPSNGTRAPCRGLPLGTSAKGVSQERAMPGPDTDPNNPQPSPGNPNPEPARPPLPAEPERPDGRQACRRRRPTRFPAPATIRLKSRRPVRRKFRPDRIFPRAHSCPGQPEGGETGAPAVRRRRRFPARPPGPCSIAAAGRAPAQRLPARPRRRTRAGTGPTPKAATGRIARRMLERCNGVLQPPATGDPAVKPPPEDTGATPVIPPGVVPQQPSQTR